MDYLSCGLLVSLSTQQPVFTHISRVRLLCVNFDAVGWVTAGAVLAENFWDLTPGGFRLPFFQKAEKHEICGQLCHSMSVQGHHCLLVELTPYSVITCIAGGPGRKLPPPPGPSLGNRKSICPVEISHQQSPKVLLWETVGVPDPKLDCSTIQFKQKQKVSLIFLSSTFVVLFNYTSGRREGYVTLMVFLSMSRTFGKIESSFGGIFLADRYSDNREVTPE